MSALEKPQLRGLHQSQIKRNLVGMLVVSVTGAMLLKTFMADRRKKRYVEFYKYVVVFKVLLSILFRCSSPLDSVYDLRTMTRSTAILSFTHFCRTYDPEKQLKKMNESGFMQSYLPPYKK